jgi:hypothetical protein
MFTFEHTLWNKDATAAWCHGRLLRPGGTRGKSPIILDNDLVQSVLEDVLTDGGFQVVITSSGEKAVELLDTSRGQ